MNAPDQPVVRVSWDQAMAFCRWLSERTGRRFTLPMESQWEYACRAGTMTPLYYGESDADFAPWANLADLSFGDPDATLSEHRFKDGFAVTAPVGRFGPNAWGLYDMHGNAAEWTASTYRTYGTDGTDTTNDERRVVRGGSFFDRPQRCRSAFRLDYLSWQRVFNVGFRVVCDDAES